MRTRLLLVPLLIGGLGFAACDDDDDPIGPATEFSASLSGPNEVPPQTTNATGTATFEVDGNSIDFTLTTTGLTNADVTAAHIHGPADTDENADVIVPLFISATEGAWTGTKTASFDVGDFAAGQGVTTMAALLALMRSGDTYVNVHTTAVPAGIIRGQITPD